MILPALKDFRGYVDVFAFDCQHPLLKNANEQVLQQFQSCEPRNTQKLSLFYLVVPPEVKINPYTGDLMQKQIVEFRQQDVQMDKNAIKKWIQQNMPDYSIKISSKSDYDRLVHDPNDKDINKVILFSKKE